MCQSPLFGEQLKKFHGRMNRKSPLKRKTPLKTLRPLRRTCGLKASGSPLKKSKLKQVSEKRKGENDEYARLRKEFLAANPICKVCQDIESRNKGPFIIEQNAVERLSHPMPATEVHHRGRRAGKWLTRVEFFLPVCRPHHDFIEMHGDWARENGYLLTPEMIRLFEEVL